MLRLINTRRPVAVIFDRYVFLKIQAMFQKVFLDFLHGFIKLSRSHRKEPFKCCSNSS